MNDTGQSTSGTTAMAWTFVGIQAILIVLMVFGPRDTGFSADGAVGAFSTIASIAGAVVGVWSAVYLGKGLTRSSGVFMRDPDDQVTHLRMSRLLIKEL